MGNLTSSSQGTRCSSCLSATKGDAVPPGSPQATTIPASPPPHLGPHSLHGITIPPPPSPSPLQVSPNVQDEKSVLTETIQGLRKHLPELYRQLRVATQLDPDVARVILDTVDNAIGGAPWPVRLALQAVLFLADNALKVVDNADDKDKLASMLEEVKHKLQGLTSLVVPDEFQSDVKRITSNLVGACAVFDDIARQSDRRVCGTSCLRALMCAQCDAKKLFDVIAGLQKLLGDIRDIKVDIFAQRIERPCIDLPELPPHLVAMEKRELKVMKFLENAEDNIRVVGLHGQGGIGKTTLMMVIETNLRVNSTHKIASLSLGMGQPDFLELQKSLYSLLSDGSKESFTHEPQGKGALKRLMESLKSQKKKICISLDNVWDADHLSRLLPEHDLPDVLPCGSFLIISSRSARVTRALAKMCFKTRQEETEGYMDYELSMLPMQDAKDLFVKAASTRGEELRRDDPLVEAIVPQCGGLPLALAVYGSFFRDWEYRQPAEWKRVLRQLERAEDLSGEQKVFKKLEESVYFQIERLQDAFLDTALFWYTRGAAFLEIQSVMEEDDDLQRLVDQSLVIRRREGTIYIHDLLLAVAKQIAKARKISFVTKDTSKAEIDELSLPNEQKHSNIIGFDESVWCKHAKNGLYPSSAQIRDVRYLIFMEGEPSLVNQRRREFKAMTTKHCRSLHVLLQFQVEEEDISLAQEQLSWIANLTHLRSLSVEADSFASIPKIWSPLRAFHVQLRGHNRSIHQDLPASLLQHSFTTLTSLHITYFNDKTLPQWVGRLSSLTDLWLSNGPSLAELPKEIGQLGSLTRLGLSECMSLAELPKEIGQLSSLTGLSLLVCTSLAKLPKEIGQLGSLARLYLSRCTSLAELPKEIRQLGSLEELRLSGCTSLAELPKEIGQLGSLEELHLSKCTSLAELPKEIEQLGSLAKLYLSGCTSLAELPKELGQLSSLTGLSLLACTSLAKLPKEIGHLGSLARLYLSGCTSLTELPKEIGQLGSLEELHLSKCTSLAELPKEIGQLGSLAKLDLSVCTSLVELPKEIGQLGSLAKLDLSGCTSLAELPKEIKQLRHLGALYYMKRKKGGNEQ